MPRRSTLTAKAITCVRTHQKNLTAVAGGQYIYKFDKCLFMPADLTAGFESLNHDNLKDRATDLEKYRDAALEEIPNATGDELQQLIDKYTPNPLNQIINIYSVYAQNEWKRSASGAS